MFVLLYHRVAEESFDPWKLSVSPDRFLEHMSVLKQEADVIPLHAWTTAANNLERPTVAITFDDGYADNLLNAEPMLRQVQLPATVFVCTAPIAEEGEYWWDKLERLLLWPSQLPATFRNAAARTEFDADLSDASRYDDATFRRDFHWCAWDPPPTSRHALFYALWEKLHRSNATFRKAVLDELTDWAGPAAHSRPRHRAMTIAELQTLSRSPFVDIGAHTVNHSALSALTLAEQEVEVEGSRSWLELHLGIQVRGFSYPFGREIDFTPDTAAIVRSAGFDYSCANVPGVVSPEVDPFALRRMYVGNWSREQFAAQLRKWSTDFGVGS